MYAIAYYNSKGSTVWLTEEHEYTDNPDDAMLFDTMTETEEYADEHGLRDLPDYAGMWKI